MKPLVSIIVPTKNEGRNIRRCLKSIKAQDYPKIEIVIVDNDSNDKTLAIAREYTSRIFRYGPERSNQRNFGVKKARGQIFVFLDADMEIERTVISEAVEILNTVPRVVALIIPELSVGKTYWAKVRALERSCYTEATFIQAARVFRKEAFLKVSGFDEKLVAAEDWDLTDRISKVGKIERITAKISHHEERFSLVSHLRKKFYYAQNVRYYQKKHPLEFKIQAGVNRVLIFVKNWKKLIADPIHGIGVFILKSLEYFTFLLTQ